jgi:hypothetical protein
MANREDRPREHLIEPARSARSACRSCGQLITSKELRLSEAFVSDEGKWARSHQYARSARTRSYDEGDDRHGRSDNAINPEIQARYHHLACAATHQPYKLRSALAATPLEVPERAALERAIGRALAAVDVAEEAEVTRDEYLHHLARLAEDLDDEDALVFGDWLQSVGDPRGELAAIQHALETATGDDRLRLAESERKLIAANRKRLVPEAIDPAMTLTWRRGFVRRVTLANVGPAVNAAFSHPSFRLVRELVIETEHAMAIAPNLPAPLPSTLRVLELVSKAVPLGQVGAAMAAAAQLERLKLVGAAELGELKHAALVELEIGCVDAGVAAPAVPRGEARTFVERLAQLRRKDLPALARLHVRVEHGLDEAVAVLVQTKLLAGLHTLALHGDLSLAGLRELTAGRKKLEVLDLRGTKLVGPDAELGKKAASEVLSTAVGSGAATVAKRVGEWLVRHTRRPEWGIGKVVGEHDHGLSVEFEHAGAKDVRNIELLEEIS